MTWKTSMCYSVYWLLAENTLLSHIASCLWKEIVVTQLLHFLTSNSLFELFQSCFRATNNSETNLFRVCDDDAIAVNSHNGSCGIAYPSE